ncbi:hypothetical protein RAC89_00400 [Paenibacillus sp. GD4]|uniref:hypothetical protein n=1 Tax=Paenibacillus sp. GD4 TaxID=3068890 RepID=UPI002796E1D7|nr:hypothetical protein [Paenibacillus sp. GD4]MDQ1908958.1 hypothetical protein [Paenibacillus sp. GD4]
MTEIYARAERAPTHSKRSTITLFKLKDLVTIYLMVGIPYLLFAVFVAGGLRLARSELGGLKVTMTIPLKGGEPSLTTSRSS